ncbi:MAG: hypothetical protein QXR88_02325 [Candidatus Pacearchaeota archaeon]
MNYEYFLKKIYEKTEKIVSEMYDYILLDFRYLEREKLLSWLKELLKLQKAYKSLGIFKYSPNNLSFDLYRWYKKGKIFDIWSKVAEKYKYKSHF